MNNNDLITNEGLIELGFQDEGYFCHRDGIMLFKQYGTMWTNEHWKDWGRDRKYHTISQVKALLKVKCSDSYIEQYFAKQELDKIQEEHPYETATRYQHKQTAILQEAEQPSGIGSRIKKFFSSIIN